MLYGIGQIKVEEWRSYLRGYQNTRYGGRVNKNEQEDVVESVNDINGLEYDRLLKEDWEEG